MKALVCAALVAASPAMAQDCRGTPDLRAYIMTQHGGSQVFTGKAGEVLAEIWTNDKGEWALVLTYPNGVSCLMAVGTEASVGPNA